MKVFTFSLLLFLLGFNGNSQEDFEYTFRIKVAASTKPIAKTSKIFLDLKDVEEVKFEDGYYRYFVGKFETFHEAKNLLPEVQAKGYKDAYVIAIYKGKIITVDEAIMKIYGE